MESLIVEMAWKSVVTSGGALLVLHLLRRRTAAERSLAAHSGLVATLLLPAAVLLLPAWSVEAPAAIPMPLANGPDFLMPATSLAGDSGAATAIATGPGWSWSDLLPWAYFLPAALLLLATVIAVGRLFVLRARASVLVDMPWLSALAHAQRRMGFKHGTALLVSDDLVSPVSWGVMRPIILLDPRAVASPNEAEAIIAHELAHVARLDWAKLLAARLVTAAFWFNPFVWKLAAECHQLREEAADDAVLNSQVDGPDYASLLVGAARHENKAMLLAAHGVAPGKTSLSRRVARVLDGGLSRAPARRTWALVCAVVAILLSAPLAALTPVAPGLDLVEAKPAAIITSIVAPSPRESTRIVVRETDGSTISIMSVAGGRQTGVPTPPLPPVPSRPSAPPVAPEIPNAPAAASSLNRLAAQATAIAATATQVRPAVDQIISEKIHGVTPGYVDSLVAANPRLRGLSRKDLVSFRIHGVTANFVRMMASAGYDELSGHDLLQAKILGVTPDYVRGLSDLGYRRLPMSKLVEMRIHRVTPEYIGEARRAGLRDLSADELIRMRIFNVNPAGLGGNRPQRSTPRSDDIDIDIDPDVDPGG